MVSEFNDVIDILCTFGKVQELSPDQDIYDAGVSSVCALSILMELESAFEVTIPDEQFIAARTPRALKAMISSLKAAQI